MGCMNEGLRAKDSDRYRANGRETVKRKHQVVTDCRIIVVLVETGFRVMSSVHIAKRPVRSSTASVADLSESMAGHTDI
jgi:hypothetical protein